MAAAIRELGSYYVTDDNFIVQQQMGADYFIAILDAVDV